MHIDPVVLAALTLVAAGWLAGIRRVGAGVPAARSRWFVAGIVVLLVALVSPLAGAAEERFSVHMVQHLLLTYVAAPFLALAAPVTLLLQAVTPRFRRGIVLPALHSRPVRILSHPVVAWVAFGGVMYVTHFSGIYEASLRSGFVHGLEHLGYLTAAVLFWWPVVRRDPVPGSFPWPARLLYLLVALPVQSLLGLAIYSSDTPLYASYVDRAGSVASALEDQQVAGAIMWVGGDLLMLVAIGFAVAAWFRHEERATARLDARLDAARAGS